MTRPNNIQIRAAASGATEAPPAGVTNVKTILDAGIDMNDIVSLCKRRGFIFPSSDIYSGFNGFYDYGPLGVELRNNIKKAWWLDMVQARDDMVGLDSSIIASPQIWQASGHIDGFSDPMVDCKKSKMRYRADQLFWGKVTVDGEEIGCVSVMEAGNMAEQAKKAAKKMAKKAEKKGELVVSELKDYTEATPEERPLIPSPATGEPGSLTDPREFNLMFQTNVGALSDSTAVAYLRPETAQGIFVNFKNVASTGRVKIPFGIGQIGKAFRNEITPRNFIFRSREFEQMEIEYFIPPGDDVWQEYHQAWLDRRYNWHLSVGLREELLSFEVHPDHKLAHYARACTDIMFQFPFGIQELEGCAARGNFDLSSHSEASGKSMEYNDPVTKEKYVPHVIEPSVGVDRLMLAIICSAYSEDEVNGEARTLLKFNPRMAPIKAAVFPLVKNKPELVEAAQRLHKQLQRRYNVIYDTAGQIGRRYRRMDEAGTPFCITVDFDTLEDGTVTVRDRDTTEQLRMPMEKVLAYLDEQIEGPMTL